MCQYKNSKSITKKTEINCKNRIINGCESMSKDKLLRIINNKRDRKSFLNQKKKKPKKSL